MGAGTATTADGQLQIPGPSAAAGPAESGSWAPHGRLLTASLVALNVFLVLLVYVYFYRFFSRAPRCGGSEEDDAPSDEEEASPPVSPKARDRRVVERAITALPVFVHSSCSGGGGAAAPTAECAICIAEFADGEEGRLLPRCGHRFHARCVDTWFRFHTTCPLCRASVLVDAPEPPPPAVATGNLSADTDSDCPCPPV